MATVKEVLIQARELIADPERWTQNTTSRNAEGNYTPSTSDNAVAWCAAGACTRIAGVFTPEGADPRDLLNQCARAAGFKDGDVRPIANLNDSTDHATVLKAFDCAIAKADA